MATLSRSRTRQLRPVTLLIPLGIALLVGALVVLPLWIAAALVAGLIVVTLTIIEPAFGLYAAILSVPVQEVVSLPAGLTVTQAVVFLAFSTWILRVLAHPERKLGLRLLAPWLLFLGVQVASIVFTPYSKIEGLLQFARWVASFLAFLLALGTITDRRRAWGLLIALLLGPAIAALIGLFQFVTASAPASFLILGGRFARAYATFGKPNPFAGYLNMSWPLAVVLAGFFISAKRRENLEPRTKNLTEEQANKGTKEQSTETLPSPTATDAEAGGGLGKGSGVRASSSVLGSRFLVLIFTGFAFLLLAGLFASYSRGGWIGSIAGLAVLAIVTGRRTAALFGLFVIVGLLVGLLGAFSLLPAALTDRLQTITDNLRIFDAGQVSVTPDNFAIVERMAHWQAGWRMFSAYPLFGVGAGNFNVAYPEFFVAPWATSQGHAHNYYIHTLAETGIFGLLSYLLLIGAMVREALRARRRLDGSVWGLAGVGVCGIIAAVAGHNIFENLHVLNMGIQLSGVWALSIIAQRWTDDPASA
ncbi:MAG: O-antigen ligase family protein [Chloroflexi bacterium]|nr:O-antigen ligase family protein [Chloroflexota bacterium]